MKTILRRVAYALLGSVIAQVVFAHLSDNGDWDPVQTVILTNVYTLGLFTIVPFVVFYVIIAWYEKRFRREDIV